MRLIVDVDLNPKFLAAVDIHFALQEGVIWRAQMLFEEPLNYPLAKKRHCFIIYEVTK